MADTTFENINLPDVLYKYRSWHNPEHRYMLTDYQIYFSPPFNLDEQHECQLELDIDYITNESLFLYFDQKTPRGAFQTSEERKQYIEKQIKESPVHDPKHREMVVQLAKKNLNEQLSIFCACENKNNLNLWRTFGADLEGFCIGFHTKKMFNGTEIFGSGGPVNYESYKLKPFYLDESVRLIDMSKVIFNLDKKFKDENEYRLSKFFLKEKKVHLQPEAYKEIILGPLMDESQKKEIIDNAVKMLPHVEIIQAKFHEDLEIFSFEPVK